MKTRKVLTIDHVFRILASVSAGKSWKEAFLDTLPARKGAEAKEAVESAESESEKAHEKVELELKNPSLIENESNTPNCDETKGISEAALDPDSCK